MDFNTIFSFDRSFVYKIEYKIIISFYITFIYKALKPLDVVGLALWKKKTSALDCLLQDGVRDLIGLVYSKTYLTKNLMA